MKVVCISDTHGLHKTMHHSMPKGDILCVAGDITNVGKRDDVESFGAWLSKLPYEKKFVIAGNHDWCFQNSGKKKAPQWLMKDESIIYLQDSYYIYKGLKIYGSPWQPRFYDWAFNVDRGHKIREKWKLIPDDTDILITHGPPAGILDLVPFSGSRPGCVDLLDRVIEVRPKLHVFGHTHHEHGTYERGSTIYVNAAVCNEKYTPNRKPIVVEI